MDPVRVAVIGCGALANGMHYPSLAAMPDVSVVACCDLDPAKREATAARFGLPASYADWRTMIAEQTPDAVWALMPPHVLHDVAVGVLETGTHLFVEKPPGVTRTQCASWARLAERRGLLTMCGFNRRFMPVLEHCLPLVRERGPIDQLAVTFYKHHFAGPYYGGAIDILTCDAIHAVDLLRHLGGEVRRVASAVRCTGGEDYCNSFNALLEFESGGIGSLLTHWTVGKRFHHAEFHARGITCYAEFEREGTVWADNQETPLLHCTAAELAGGTEVWRTTGFFGEDRHFVECVRAGQQPLSHLGDAVRTMELVERIHQASWT